MSIDSCGCGVYPSSFSVVEFKVKPSGTQSARLTDSTPGSVSSLASNWRLNSRPLAEESRAKELKEASRTWSGLKPGLNVWALLKLRMKSPAQISRSRESEICATASELERRVLCRPADALPASSFSTETGLRREE